MAKCAQKRLYLCYTIRLYCTEPLKVMLALESWYPNLFSYMIVIFATQFVRLMCLNLLQTELSIILVSAVSVTACTGLKKANQGPKVYLKCFCYVVLCLNLSLLCTGYNIWAYLLQAATGGIATSNQAKVSKQSCKQTNLILLISKRPQRKPKPSSLAPILSCHQKGKKFACFSLQSPLPVLFYSLPQLGGGYITVFKVYSSSGHGRPLDLQPDQIHLLTVTCEVGTIQATVLVLLLIHCQFSSWYKQYTICRTDQVLIGKIFV